MAEVLPGGLVVLASGSMSLQVRVRWRKHVAETRGETADILSSVDSVLPSWILDLKSGVFTAPTEHVCKSNEGLRAALTHVSTGEPSSAKVRGVSKSCDVCVGGLRCKPHPRCTRSGFNRRWRRVGRWLRQAYAFQPSRLESDRSSPRGRSLLPLLATISSASSQRHMHRDATRSSLLREQTGAFKPTCRLVSRAETRLDSRFIRVKADQFCSALLCLTCLSGPS